MGSRLTEDDVKRYLIHVYFGPVNNAPVKRAVNRAYRDFNRTMRGFSLYPDRVKVRSSASGYLQQELTTLGTANIPNQAQFDRWHETVCTKLKGCYGDFRFTFGQAQKWVNMAVKYLFVLDRVRIEKHWQYCHVPVDQILLEQLRQRGHTPPPIGNAWSRLDSYTQYLDFQQWFRNQFHGAPMDSEFELWMGPTPGG